MFKVTDALVLEIAADGDGGMVMRLRHETPNGGGFTFLACTDNEKRSAWMRDLHVGDVVEVEGVPYPFLDKLTERWGVALDLADAS